MGAAFVRRRMQAELGADWRARFPNSILRRPRPLRSARCTAPSASKASASPASCNIPTWPRRWRRILPARSLVRAASAARAAVDTREIAREIRERMREELDYSARPSSQALSGHARRSAVRARSPYRGSLSTRRLLTMQWLEGERLSAFKRPRRSRATPLPRACSTPGGPRSRFGVIHGDPHLGNYTVASSGEGHARRRGVNLFDYGCVRIFPPRFVGGVVEHRGLQSGDEARSSKPTRCGASPGCRAECRGDEHLGSASSAGPWSTTACAPSPTASGRPNTAEANSGR